jgi:hypothetical protein
MLLPIGGGGEPLGSNYLRTRFRGTTIKSHNISSYQNRFWFGSYFEWNGIMYFKICFFEFFKNTIVMNDGNDKQIYLLYQFTSHFSSIEFELHSSYMQCDSIFSFKWNLIFHFYIISSPLIICSNVEPKLMMGECLILLVLQKFIIFFVLKKMKWNAFPKINCEFSSFPQMVNMTHLLLF